jgi:hypothetical protein
MQEARNFAEEHHIFAVETSALSAQNVEEAFINTLSRM